MFEKSLKVIPKNSKYLQRFSLLSPLLRILLMGIYFGDKLKELNIFWVELSSQTIQL